MLRRDALAAARVTNKTEEIEALGDVLVGAESLRSDLMENLNLAYPKVDAAKRKQLAAARVALSRER